MTTTSNPTGTTPTHTRWDAWLYALTIFISAFLLFQVQPMIAKMILPWFGGTSAVWSTCMLFFQMALLLGYVYAHWLHALPPRRQAIVHSCLLVLSLAVLPVLPNATWKPTDASDPSWLILGLLSVTIGLPYLALSTTSPLLQSWYARRAGSVPYRLFALSNFASMLALLSYPILIEPAFTVRTQSWAWSTGYAVFTISCAAAAWIAARGQNSTRKNEPRVTVPEGPAPTAALRTLWIALAACASTLLLAVTTFLTSDIAAIPFLWVLPLAVYLITFILCFESNKIYHRGVFYPLLVGALGCFAYFLDDDSMGSNMVLIIALLALSLFVCCMVCHGELARLKPHPSRLTGYYVMISIGGAIGGLFVGLLAPNVFNGYHEFPLSLGLCAGLAAYLLFRDWDNVGPAKYRQAVAFVLITAVVGYATYVVKVERYKISGYKAIARNFYGQLRVEDDGKVTEPDAYRKLLHGRIDHGIQMHDPKLRRTPVAYFCEASGIGHAMQARPVGVPWKVGIVGLGAGALAPYGKPGDTFRIYEINPLVLDMANEWFTYLKDTPAKVEVALGDGRLVLEREPSQQFDLLVMDAFSGDSVPVHLITKEAFDTYFRHLKPGGILAVNTSNRYLDLQPVMERAATAFGKKAINFDYWAKDDELLCSSSSWVLLVDGSLAASSEALKTGKVLTPFTKFRMWTDDFSNMLSILQ